MVLQPGGEDEAPAPIEPPTQMPEAGAPQDGGMPSDAWQGLDAGEMETLLARAPMPLPSPALADALAKALAAGFPRDRREMAVRVQALERSGRVAELVELLRGSTQSGEPAALTRYALALLASGRDDEACGAAAADLAADAKRAALLIPAYCAALSGDKQGASLALNLARDGGIDTAFASASIGGAQPALPKSIDVLDYVFLKLGKTADGTEIVTRATPELLYRLARDKDAAASVHLAAAERAAALNIIDGETLGQAYREAASGVAKSAQSPASLRARLFVALAGQQDATTQAESIDALLASAKDAKIEVPMAEALAPAVTGLADDRQQSAPLAEVGLRVAALAGEDEAAWTLSQAGGDRLTSWQLLLAAGDPSSERARTALASGVEIATKSGLPGALLQRLVTVLDALGEDIPIPLWDLASKTPQPEGGYLPETGVLTSLKEASDKGEAGRTILLVATALGPDGPQGANLIALGDSLRALRRVGLDAEARRLAVEALAPHWPSRGKA
jgi:hypothetical protein